MALLFFSYSHNDENLRDKLEIHLTSLKRQGILESWHDRMIGAGKDFEDEISEHLEKANIILLLISSDFIASDYCFGKEMTRAIERNNSGEARVIPVILRPCNWRKLPFGKLLATPADGKPVTKFPDQDDAFLEITKAVEEAITESGAIKSEPVEIRKNTLEHTGKIHSEIPRSSNLRIKKSFTDYDKDAFFSEAYEYISNYFEGSLSELKKRNSKINTQYKRVDAYHFVVAVYFNGLEKNRCTIWFSGQKSFPFQNSINYSQGESLGNITCTESFSIQDDGYTMALKASGVSLMRRNVPEQLSYEGAAEYFWSIFIEPMQ